MARFGILEAILTANNFYFNEGILKTKNSDDKLLNSLKRCSSELDSAVYSFVDYRPFGDMSDIKVPDSKVFVYDYSVINEHMVFYALKSGSRSFGYLLAEKAAMFSDSIADKGAYKHHILGLSYTQLNDFRESIFEFEQSLLMDPNNPNACIMLGRAYEQLNDAVKARTAYENALKCNLSLCTIPQPNNIGLMRHYSLAIFHINHDEFAKAVKNFEECIRLEPNDTSFYIQASHCYEILEKYSDALQCIRYGLFRCPDKKTLKFLEERLSKKVKF